MMPAPGKSKLNGFIPDAVRARINACANGVIVIDVSNSTMKAIFY